MTELLRHGVLPRSFFEAYGHGEVAATTAVGAVCSQCPGFGASVVEMATGKSAVPISVRLEQHTGEDKRTDIELATSDGLIVIEAHPAYGKGWPHHAPNYFAFRFDGKLQRISHVQVQGLRPGDAEPTWTAPDRRPRPVGN